MKKGKKNGKRKSGRTQAKSGLDQKMQGCRIGARHPQNCCDWLVQLGDGGSVSIRIRFGPDLTGDAPYLEVCTP